MASETVAPAQGGTIDADQRRTLFWAKGRPELPPMMQEILVQYSGIPKNETVSHVEGLRERAWAVFPYPCIGRYRFLTCPMMHHRLYYSHIVKTLKQEPFPAPDEELASPLYLELGVCFGQELRALMHQGVPASRLYGADIEPKFIAMGYDLFRDEDKFPSSHQIAPVDLFDKANFEPMGRLGKFLGKVDILQLTSVFHLWSYEKQVQAAHNVMPLMRSGGYILGCQTANLTPTEYPRMQGDMMFRHNSKSWEEMWMTRVAENGLITDPNTSVKGAKLKVYSELIEIDKRDMPKGVNVTRDEIAPNWMQDPDFRWMRFDIQIGDRDES